MNNKNQINMEEFISITKKYLPDNEIKNIVEIGSLDGADSIFFKSHYPNSNVFCIEGLPDNYNQYLSNLKTVIPINAVIANYNGYIKYHKKNINGIHGILDRGQEYGSEVLDLPCYTMKTICENYKIDSMDLVKIDVEGASYEILESMGDIAKSIKIMHIETESYEFFKGQKLHNIVSDFLLSLGFTMIDKTDVLISGGYQHDSVWLNNKFIKK